MCNPVQPNWVALGLLWVAAGLHPATQSNPEQPRATQHVKNTVFLQQPRRNPEQPRATQSIMFFTVFQGVQPKCNPVQPSWVALGLHLGCTWVALGCSWVFPKIVPKPSRNPEKAMGNLPVIAFPPKMCLSLPKTKKNCK